MTTSNDNSNYLLKPKVDFIFKKLFCNPQNQDILISFLSCFLNQILISAELVNTSIMNVHIDSDTFMMEFDVKTSENISLDIIINIKNERNTTVRTEKRIEYLIMEQLLTYEEVSETNSQNKNDKDIYIYLLNLEPSHTAYKHIAKFIDGSAEFTVPLQEIVGSYYLNLLEPLDTTNIKTPLDIWNQFLVAPSLELLGYINLLELSESQKESLKQSISKAYDELVLLSNSQENIHLYDEHIRDLAEFNKQI